MTGDASAGDAQFFKGESVMEEISTRCFPCDVGVVRSLTAVALIGEGVVGVLGEVVIPAELSHPGTSGLGAGEGDCGQRPEHV